MAYERRRVAVSRKQTHTHFTTVTQGHFVEFRMVKPFLPELSEKDICNGYTPLTYLLRPKGFKGFQKLVDTSPYGPLPQDTD